MELIFNHLYVVDLENKVVNKAEFQESQPLKNYIISVLDKVTTLTGDREYRFQSESLTMQECLRKFISQQEIEETSLLIANKLLREETTTQGRIERLGKEIQKGILIISFVNMGLPDREEKKIVISKADYDEFIEETTGTLKTGLATKKKIYKAFVANISVVNGEDSIVKMTTYDCHTAMATYWWKDFLELDLVRKNDVNTLRAFNTIEKYILDPLCKDHKQDYLHLWNATLIYFRATGEFNMEIYKDEIIGRHQPFDRNISISDLQRKCEGLPQKGEFDNRFPKDIKGIKGKKLKKTLKLTSEIDLLIKSSIPNLNEVLQGGINDAGEKFLMIKTNEGYEYAKNECGRVNRIVTTSLQ